MKLYSHDIMQQYIKEYHDIFNQVIEHSSQSGFRRIELELKLQRTGTLINGWQDIIRKSKYKKEN